jgi:hypothetical protein
MKNLNLDQKMRDKIIGEHDEKFRTSSYFGGIKHFKNLPATAVRYLLVVGLAHPDERQNLYGPSIEEFVDFMEKYPEVPLTAHGYVVSKEREDYRVSIEGLHAKSENIPEEVQKEFALAFRKADELKVSSSELYCWYD